MSINNGRISLSQRRELFFGFHLEFLLVRLIIGPKLAGRIATNILNTVGHDQLRLRRAAGMMLPPKPMKAFPRAKKPQPSFAQDRLYTLKTYAQVFFQTGYNCSHQKMHLARKLVLREPCCSFWGGDAKPQPIKKRECQSASKKGPRPASKKMPAPNRKERPEGGAAS